MQRKLTISIDQHVYEGLHALVGRGKISRFLENLARPYVLSDDLALEYAAMSSDEEREQAATEWTEALTGDGPDA